MRPAAALSITDTEAVLSSFPISRLTNIIEQGKKGVIRAFNDRLWLYPLPVLQFAGGHVAFIQHLPERYAKIPQAQTTVTSFSADYEYLNA